METHVVFGAGQVGAPLAQALLAAGHRVRVVRRSQGAVPAGAEAIMGDAFDRAFAVRCAEGATTVYHCLNTAYSLKAWAADLPRLQENLIDAAARAKAWLVVFENLYMLGRPAAPLSEATEPQPCSKKGELRRALSQALFEAHRAGTVRAVSGRASHLFGPGVTQSQVGEQFFTRVLAGKPAQVFGNPDALHSFSYAPDVGRALAALGSDEGALGQAWMLPVMPASSSRAFYQALFAALGVKAELSVVSPFLLSLLGLVVPLLREMREMNYEWEHDYLVDDSKFRTRFRFTSTELTEALRATAAWARQTYGARQG